MPKESRGYGGRGPRRYVYEPVGMDLWDPRPHQPQPGTEVHITAGPGVGRAQKPFAYVENAETGEVHGMVNRASLRPAGRKKKQPDGEEGGE